MTEQQLIAAVKNGKRKAQKLLFDRYSPQMLGVAKRYVKVTEDAEDVLVSAFFKVMTNLEQFQGTGSFEGWIRRIVVNEALMLLRKRHNFNLTLEAENFDIQTDMTVEEDLAAQDLLQFLEQLPDGYRTVFNLYVLEGFKHREIADQLGISINTSKSQLILAKKRLKDILEKANYMRYG
ncbi:MAG: sigma-70 family RNA polymerase sigma factor [Saprospiraceae bacterium]|nr:sigma-70 family RNA polymerase sigma factor [Saprospiraceae bacterium]MCB9322554.1 sigma-70 family RNA polymerase sigma factor [Lewinellaceae bacterium]